MPGLDLKYGEVISSKKEFHDGEPVFVLRAQDALAPAAINRYESICVGGGADEEHCQAIKLAREAFIGWQKANPDLVKTPDS